MKKYLLMVLAVLTLGIAPVLAQDNPTAGRKVQLLDDNGNVVQTATTNAAGEFTFQKIEIGEYTINVEQDQIDNARQAARKAKKAAKKAAKAAERTADDNDDVDSGLDASVSFTMSFEQSSDYEVKSPRDAASGQASGKRTHHPVTFVKEWGAATPQLKVKKSGTTFKGNWDLATAKGG